MSSVESEQPDPRNGRQAIIWATYSLIGVAIVAAAWAGYRYPRTQFPLAIACAVLLALIPLLHSRFKAWSKKPLRTVGF